MGGAVDANTKKFQNKSGLSYAGKGGEHKETSGAGVSFFAGANRETEKTKVGTQTVGSKTEISLSASPLPGLGALQATYSQDNGQSGVRAGYSNGASIGLFLNFSFTFELGVEVTQKRKE